jgi:hypothetical protein
MAKNNKRLQTKRGKEKDRGELLVYSVAVYVFKCSWLKVVFYEVQVTDCFFYVWVELLYDTVYFDYEI